MKRGEIYYIANRDAVGAETAKSRPGVIVSHDALNNTSEVVEVVYLTTRPKKDLPTHAEILATGRPSVALCEQIDHVSVQLVGNYCGTCSAKEMDDINAALMHSLSLWHAKEEKTTQSDAVNHPSHYNTGKIEVIDFIEDQGLGFNLGNVVKYTARAGKKNPDKTLEDLQKAAFYLDREIKRLSEEAC